MHLSKRSRIFCFLLLWRLASVFIVQTAHVPDEYWQSLEVAHNLAFGYGYQTWEWHENIRSYIYPFIISILYRILALLSLDYVPVLITLPRIIQAVVSAYGEYKFYELTQNDWTTYSLCINWYWYYCASRTIANTLETALTMIALSVFPWRDSNTKSLQFLWIVGFLCILRPTAAIIWLPLCCYHFGTSSQKKLVLLYKYFSICTICILFCIFFDSISYGNFVFSPWEFFYRNVLYKAGDLYGKQHILWYLFSGLPVLLGLYYIVFIFCVWHLCQYPTYYHRQSVMLLVIGWTVGVYSLLSHKEFRFLLPLLPMFLYICTSCRLKPPVKFVKIIRKILISLLVISNILPAIYFSMIHQRGTLDVMEVLRNDITNNHNTSSILFLTPCHATPLYSHLHVNVQTKILTCVPNFNGSTDYMDEADTFFAEPMSWLTNHYGNVTNNLLPSHIVAFDSVISRIKEFLKGYKVHAAIFHAHFPASNYGKYIYVYKRT